MIVHPPPGSGDENPAAGTVETRRRELVASRDRADAAETIDPATRGPLCVCWPDRSVPDAPVLRETLPAVPRSVRVFRARVRAWVADLALPEELAESIVLIVDEAITNAVEHACPDWDCEIELVAAPRACGGGVAVEVSDNGVWQPPGDPGHRGRGVLMMGRLSDRSSVVAGDAGTTARMCWATGPG